MHLPYTIVLIPEEDNTWGALIVELPGCVGAGRTIIEALEMLEDAKQGWLISSLNHDDVIPEPIENPYEWLASSRPIHLTK
jgi:predicted RNase H-like HicB family nuclease